MAGKNTMEAEILKEPYNLLQPEKARKICCVQFSFGELQAEISEIEIELSR